MRRVLLSALLIGAALAPAAALSGHATAASAAAPKAKKACFYSDDVRSWRWVDDRTVNIQAGGKQVYQLKLFADCPDLRTAQSIGVKTPMGQGFVCDALDIDLITPSPIGPRTCPVTSIRQMSAAELAALPKSQQP